MALNIVFEKKYRMPYFTLFWSIYTNLGCSLMSNTEILNLPKSKIILILSRHTSVKKKVALNIICHKKYLIPYSTHFGVYTPTPYALSCKIQKFYI